MFQVEEDLEFGNPSQGVQGLLLHDTGSGPLVGVPKGEECKGKVDEGKKEERLDYGSSPKWEALKGSTVHSQLCSEVHVVKNEAIYSNEV